METQTQDMKRSARILAIMKAAGNPLEKCPDCGQAAGAPFRHYEEGKVKFGCVSAFHTEAMLGYVSNTSSWHFRKEAKALRLKELRWLESL